MHSQDTYKQNDSNCGGKNNRTEKASVLSEEDLILMEYPLEIIFKTTNWLDSVKTVRLPCDLNIVTLTTWPQQSSQIQPRAKHLRQPLNTEPRSLRLLTLVYQNKLCSLCALNVH